jgi:YfiR/HmsC-like
MAHAVIILVSAMNGICAAHADDLPEYQLKAEYIYRFAQYTGWPAEIGSTLNFCVHGPDPFGAALDALQGKTVEHRGIAVMRNVSTQALESCQIVFIASAATDDIPLVLEHIKGRPVLIVADTAGAARRGVTLNLAVVNGHITFEANMQAARAARINLSSRLLRLATQVIP